jgi:hypothetical protein
MGGSVSFTFVTFAGSTGAVYDGDSGGPDESWLLGTVPITPGAGGGTATLSTEVPPGLYGKAYLVAMYGGDKHYLASSSAEVPLGVTGSTLAVSPMSITLAPNQQTTFTATGGTPPILWGQEGTDTTCSDSDAAMGCSLYEPESPTKVFFQAGPSPGAIVLVAIDAQGEEAIIRVKIQGTPVVALPFPTFDAGAPGGPGPGYVDGAVLPLSPDAFPDDSTGGQDSTGFESEDSGAGGDSSVATDSGTAHDSGLPHDGGPATDSGAHVDSGAGDSGAHDASTSTPTAKSGCSCVAAGAHGGGPSGALEAGGLLLGLFAVLRRRRAGSRSERIGRIVRSVS